jgi:hypothetical protein
MAQAKKRTFPMFEAFLRHKKVFAIGKGENIWHYIHVQDLSNLYLLLGEAAVDGGPPATSIISGRKWILRSR